MPRRAGITGPRTGQLKTLSEIGRTLTNTTSLDEVAHVTIERGAALVDAAGAVLMLSDDGGQMHVRATWGIPDSRVSRFQAPTTGETIARLQGLLGLSDERLIAVPLVVGGSVTGLIAVGLQRAGT